MAYTSEGGRKMKKVGGSPTRVHDINSGGGIRPCSYKPKSEMVSSGEDATIEDFGKSAMEI